MMQPVLPSPKRWELVGGIWGVPSVGSRSISPHSAEPAIHNRSWEDGNTRHAVIRFTLYSIVLSLSVMSTKRLYGTPTIMFLLASLLGLTIIPALAQATTGTAAASTTATSSVAVTCTGSPATTRDDAVNAAMTAYSSSTAAAQTLRTAAIKQASNSSTHSDRKTQVKKAWDTFYTARNTARKSLAAARNTAWAQYLSTLAACR